MMTDNNEVTMSHGENPFFPDPSEVPTDHQMPDALREYRKRLWHMHDHVLASQLERGATLIPLDALALVVHPIHRTPSLNFLTMTQHSSPITADALEHGIHQLTQHRRTPRVQCVQSLLPSRMHALLTDSLRLTLELRAVLMTVDAHDLRTISDSNLTHSRFAHILAVNYQPMLHSTLLRPARSFDTLSPSVAVELLEVCATIAFGRGCTLVFALVAGETAQMIFRGAGFKPVDHWLSYAGEPPLLQSQDDRADSPTDTQDHDHDFSPAASS
jgi:hypothetical protein